MNTENPGEDKDAARREQLLQAARRRVGEQVVELRKVLSPLDVAGLLIGAAAGIITEVHGPELAPQYLHELAEEVISDDNIASGVERV